MILSDETIGAFRSLMFEPEKHGLPFPPFKECFGASTTVRAQHLLFADYIDVIGGRPLPKIIFYVMMREAFGPPNGKDENGNLGYYLCCGVEI